MPNALIMKIRKRTITIVSFIESLFKAKGYSNKLNYCASFFLFVPFQLFA